MIENLDPELNRLQKEITPTEIDKKEQTIKSIVNGGIDQNLLEELKTKTVEERLARLEQENENRLLEVSRISLRFGFIMKQVVPMVNKLHNHFFGEGN